MQNYCNGMQNEHKEKQKRQQNGITLPQKDTRDAKRLR